MNKLRIILSLLISSLSSFGSDWVTVKIDTTAQLAFPTEPKTRDFQGNKIFFAKDSFGTYMALCNTGVGETGHVAGIYDGFIKKLLEASNKNSVYQKDIFVCGLKAKEIFYDEKGASSIEYTNKIRMVYVNNSIYTYSFIFQKAHQEFVVKADRFFDSFKLDNKQELVQETDMDLIRAKNLGEWAGKIFSLIAITSLLIFVFIKSKKK